MIVFIIEKKLAVFGFDTYDLAVADIFINFALNVKNLINAIR